MGEKLVRLTGRNLSTVRDFGLSPLSWLHLHMMLLWSVDMKIDNLHTFLSILV